MFTSTVDGEKILKKKREDIPVILISHYKGSVLKFVTHGLGKDTVLHRKEGLIHFVTKG